jgi:hypothetical protein
MASAAGCQALETERAVIVLQQILAPRGATTAIRGFTPSHATIPLALNNTKRHQAAHDRHSPSDS